MAIPAYSWKTDSRVDSSLQECLDRFGAIGRRGPLPAPATLPRGPGECAYLDYNATAPLRPEARDAILSVLDTPANASSTHALGSRARARIQEAREQLASLIDCLPSEVIFTSGATEANNLALRSLGLRDGTVVVSAVEHPAVLAAADEWAPHPPPRRVKVDGDGLIDLTDLDNALAAGASYVSIMAVNNETGVVSDLNAVVAAANRRAVPVHTDATQMIGKIPVSFAGLRVAMLSLSAHKFGGPQGVGALIVRRDWQHALLPLIHGGGQEGGRRSGTLNVAGIVGMGAAASASASGLATEMTRIASLRDALEAGLLGIANSRRNGSRLHRVPGVTNVTFGGAPAGAVMAAMPAVAVSHGSACAGGVPGESHVLAAMGVDEDDAECALRYSIGYASTRGEVEFAIAETRGAVQRVRSAATSDTHASAHSLTGSSP
jgi:cysteine desulfurase